MPIKLLSLLKEVREKALLNLAEAKEILLDIATGKGRIANLMQHRPDLKKLCQENVSRNLGHHFPVFRYVGVREGKSFRKEGSISVSTSLKSVLHVMNNSPGAVFTRTSMITVTPQIVRYDIGSHDVIASIPLLAELALRFVRAKSVQDPRSGKVQIDTLMDSVKKEQELIVDVSSMEPSINLPLRMDHERSMLWDYIRGDFKDVPSQIADMKSRGYYFNSPEEFVSIVTDFKNKLDQLTR